MHGGKCQDFGSGLNCTCPGDYRGVGCQYELDACEANVCVNGATCVDSGPGYMCICPPGFTGTFTSVSVVSNHKGAWPEFYMELLYTRQNKNMKLSVK